MHVWRLSSYGVCCRNAYRHACSHLPRMHFRMNTHKPCIAMPSRLPWRCIRCIACLQLRSVLPTLCPIQLLWSWAIGRPLQESPAQTFSAPAHRPYTVAVRVRCGCAAAFGDILCRTWYDFLVCRTAAPLSPRMPCSAAGLGAYASTLLCLHKGSAAADPQKLHAIWLL